MSRPAWRGVVVVVGLVPDDRAMRVIWRFRPADRANCNQSCGVVVARFSRVGQDGRNPWRCWIDLERLHHLPIYQPTYRPAFGRSLRVPGCTCSGSRLFPTDTRPGWSLILLSAVWRD